MNRRNALRTLTTAAALAAVRPIAAQTHGGGQLTTTDVKPIYTHTSARDRPDLEDQVRKAMAAGYRQVRVQLAVPGFSGYGVANPTSEAILKARPRGVDPSPVFEPTPYVNNTIKMFDYLRSKI